MKKYFAFTLIVVTIAAFATSAAAQRVCWDSNGSLSLTSEGWTLAGIKDDDPTKSKDFSVGYNDGGTGVWRINDNNSPTEAYMRMYKNPPGGVSSSQGLVMARIKFLSASGSTYGTFGYSSSDGNHSVVMCIRNGEINWKTAEGVSMLPNPVTVTTSGYRVYAIRWYFNGTFDAWYSNTSAWSSVQGDWTQVVSGGSVNGGSQSALTDENAVKRSGLLLGNFSGSSLTWDGCVDYICWSGSVLQPWSFDPTTSNDADWTADTIPSTMAPGMSYAVTVTMKNMGVLNPWTQADGYRLGAVGDSDPFYGSNRVNLSSSDVIGIGSSKAFSFTMTAPSTEALYTTDWRMLRENYGWFGDTCLKQVNVTFGPNPPGAPTVAYPTNGEVVMTNRPDISFTGDPFNAYEVHVALYNTPDTHSPSPGWDSGVVYVATTTSITCMSGSLSAQNTYYVFVRLRNARGWGPWSTYNLHFYVAGAFLPVTGQPTDDPYLIDDGPSMQKDNALCYNPERNEYLSAYQDFGHGSRPYISSWRLGNGADKQGAEIISTAGTEGSGMTQCAYNSGHDEYLVAYVDYVNVGYSQRIDATNGNLLGSSVTNNGVSGCTGQSLAYSSGSDVYLYVFGKGANGSVHAQRLSGSTAAPVGALITIDDQANYPPGYLVAIPRVAYNPEDDEFLVTYCICSTTSSEQDIYCRRVRASDGALLSNPTLLVGANGVQWMQHLVYAAELDKYFMVYENWTSFASIGGQFINRNGAPSGSPIVVVSRNAPEAGGGPAVAWNSAMSEFLVTWGYGNSFSFHARRVSNTGGLIGNPFRVNGSVLGNNGNYDYRVQASPQNNDYLFTWHCTYNAIWERRYKAYPLPPADVTPPGPVNNFVVAPNGPGAIRVSWTNPSDADFSGTMLRFKATSYPTSTTDGVLLCEKGGVPGSNDSFVHTGLGNTACYYTAFTYDEVPNYSSAVPGGQGSGVPGCAGVWFSDNFDSYANGNLGGKGSWVTSAGATSAQVIDSFNGHTKPVLMDCVASGGATIGNEVSFSQRIAGYHCISLDVAQDAVGTGGSLIAEVYFYSSDSATHIAKLQILKGQLKLEHSAGLATISFMATNTTWYNVRIGFNIDTRQLNVWLNGTQNMTTYTWKGDGTNLARIALSSVRNTNLSVQKAYIDNVVGDARIAQVPQVRDDGAYTPSLTTLHFNFDPAACATEYQYAVGTTSGGSTVKGWTSCGTNRDVTDTGLSLTEGTKYYISVQARNGGGSWSLYTSSDGITAAIGATIQAAKALPDNDVRAIRGKVVSAKFPGYFYIQEPDGYFGIRVVPSTGVSAGQEVAVAGAMKGTGLERYIDCTGNVLEVIDPDAGSPIPTSITNKALGGTQLNGYTPGVTDGLGPNNIGILVRTHGRVTVNLALSGPDYDGNRYLFADDGSGTKSWYRASGGAYVEVSGVKVDVNDASIPVGAYVAARGICSIEQVNGRLQAKILPPTSGDVTKLAPP